MGKRFDNQRGSALVIALIAVAAVATMGAAFVQVTGSLSRRQSREVDQTKAFYLAEAGLAEALQALRIGRTGQIGTEDEPAAYGQGLLWVDATETTDDQVRLEANAQCGAGRASLALVVEPVEQPLGFFCRRGSRDRLGPLAGRFRLERADVPRGARRARRGARARVRTADRGGPQLDRGVPLHVGARACWTDRARLGARVGPSQCPALPGPSRRPHQE